MKRVFVCVFGISVSAAKNGSRCRSGGGRQARVRPRNHAIETGCKLAPLANTIKRYLRGGDVALCQIILTTY